MSTQRGGVTLAVLAPFGTDPVLSHYPDGTSSTIEEHPLLQHLKQVANAGIGVVALIDLVDSDTYLVEIEAHKGAAAKITPRGKQDMQAPQTLTFLLREAHRHHPDRALVLALEGHGAGFLPDIDTTQLTSANATGGGLAQWRIGTDLSTPLNPDGTPFLAQGSPVLPIVCPTSPTNHLALSTYGLGAALQAALDAGVPKLACIHFNNCFNFAVEVLHTIAPYAEFATGYENYNFFTAGEAYPAVFAKLAAAGAATPQQLALWFADGNHAVLAAKGHHPTVGGVVPLQRLHSVTECVDELSDALLAALRTAPAPQRADFIQRIKNAIVRAQQFDDNEDFVLETPDELTDLCSFAHELQKEDFAPFKVAQAAAALEEVLGGIKRYGDRGTPWMAPTKLWDFSAKDLAMSIFLPDPLRIGRWDWRSPYYLDVNPDPTKPQVQRHIIDFLKVTDWVDFLIEYHKDVPFVGLLPAQLPQFPHFNRHYQPPREGGNGNGGCDAGKPSPAPR
jgi:hypothetical protein